MARAGAEKGMTKESRQEWSWVLGISLLILLMSSLPYLVGYSSQTEEKVFGGAVLDRQDYAVHLATMQLGADGEWQYSFRFTTEDHQGAYVKMA